MIETTPTFECLYCDHHKDKPGDCCLWQQKGQSMTSLHEMSQYEAEQGDMGDDGWGDLPANGEGWDKPTTVDAERMDREELGRQYKLRCNELIDLTYEWNQLLSALVKYGRHTGDCKAFPATSPEKIIRDCDCGLMAILAAAGKAGAK